MGTWGLGAFENDMALDWLAELDEGGVDAVRQALEQASEFDVDDYLDSDEATPAIAAAELVAAALSGKAQRVAASHRAWPKKHRASLKSKDAALAAAAVRRALGDNSELAALWDESDEGAQWRANTRALVTQLEGLASAPGRKRAPVKARAPAKRTPRRTKRSKPRGS